MPPQKASRAMTFTGRGIDCGGYGIRLQWVSDPMGEAHVSPVIQGRISMKLDRDLPVYKSETVDKLLSEVDQDAETGALACHGPFSAFSVTQIETTPMDTTATTLESLSQASISPEDHPNEDGKGRHLSAQITSDETEQVIDLESTPDVTFWWPPSPASSSFSLISALRNSPTDASTVGTLVSSEVQIREEGFMAEEGNCNGEDEDRPAPDTSDLSTSNDYRMVRQVHTTLFGDSQVDYLMRHYNIHVAGVLVPISHPENPFRTLYLSTAIEGILQQNMQMAKSRRLAYTALSQSLLASAAFHHWKCNQRLVEYREIGAKYRYQAIQSLRDTIKEAPLTANYQTLMMAILSLVTISVLTGEGDDFRMHIQAAAQLRSLRSRWKLMSRPSRQLNELGAFLSLMSRTVSFKPSPTSWDTTSDKTHVAETMILQSSQCYEYVYGITVAIAPAINEICHLAEHLTRFRQSKQDLPDDFLESCEELGNKLQSWRFESENITSFPGSGDFRMALFTQQAKAWHAAALIYYYTRIQDVKRAELIPEVDHVAEYIQAAEDIKLTSETIGQGESMAPITWPAFVASCNATSNRRDVWRRCWERMLCYKLENVSKQWDIVQQIWQILDVAESQGKSFSWTDAYDIVGINILPV
ncbi:lysyl oxidase-like protein 2 3 4 [Fusarium flagelliforme]|uniref:Lysyl oxidase-like protein 2 3 4 n=1 Tax=Fusarium flagelliforme TaxID=2675880 RepID=A0A395MYH1_9HYPO|nr:lysyl oxidase-like protein 2 3 4 [Fusarium flagelliforme]